MDPLAELVKIDPKSLGVGQYQHDVDQNLLRETLDNTVESCVNSVGVNLNTASSYLLSYVAGIGPALAENIVSYRTENGAYGSRRELLKVKRLGEKVFEQCAGFLRIHGAENPLDNSAVHPEAYHIVDKMAKDLGVSASELVGNAELCMKIDPSKYVTDSFGLPTINDIIQELQKPGRDPREAAQAVLEGRRVLADGERAREGGAGDAVHQGHASWGGGRWRPARLACGASLGRRAHRLAARQATRAARRAA
jgi:uncharacterized protein